MGQLKTVVIRMLRPMGSLVGVLALACAVTLAVDDPKVGVTIDPTASVMDSSDQTIGGDGLTVEVSQSDTSVRFVPPLDGNPFTREWFHSETAGYRISGAKAKTFAGHISIGYLVGYPASFNGRLSFDWKTPSLNFSVVPGGVGPFFGDLIPQLGVDLSLGNGPGVASVVAAQGDIQGPGGSVHVSNMHGTVTGVVGQLNVRPYVTVQSSHGDEITTYGRAWTS